jgi:hypothetical protein
LRGEGRGKRAEGDGENPQVRSGVGGPIYAASFTGAVKLIVNDSTQAGIMEPALKDEGGSVALNPPYGGMKDETKAS